jgi:archaeal flagellin FlaB
MRIHLQINYIRFKTISLRGTLKYIVKAVIWRDVELMGKLIDKIRKKDIGAIGIGAMIVFIAMVLVAGIAASVLIQTSGNLEMRAMQAGTETTAEVATGLHVEKIYGYSADNSAIGLLAISIRPRAGSTQVDLSETIIELTNSSAKNYFTYDSSIFTESGSIAGNTFTSSFYPAANATIFGIIVMEDADGSVTPTNPVINAGDHVVLTVNITAAFSGFETRLPVRGLVIPELGSAAVISFSTPPSYTKNIVELQ